MADTIERRAVEWMASGDTGSSSKAICCHMLGLASDGSHPHDPDDLGRCLRLLARFPLWRLRICEMAAHNAYWLALVARWDDLEQAMENEVGINWSKGRKAPQTYALIRSILDPVHEADRNVIRFGNVSVTSGASK